MGCHRSDCVGSGNRPRAARTPRRKLRRFPAPLGILKIEGLNASPPERVAKYFAFDPRGPTQPPPFFNHLRGDTLPVTHCRIKCLPGDDGGETKIAADPPGGVEGGDRWRRLIRQHPIVRDDALRRTRSGLLDHSCHPFPDHGLSPAISREGNT